MLSDAARVEILEMLIRTLSRGENCWCEKAIGHPLYRDHSDACWIVQQYFERKKVEQVKGDEG